MNVTEEQSAVVGESPDDDDDFRGSLRYFRDMGNLVQSVSLDSKKLISALLGKERFSKETAEEQLAVVDEMQQQFNVTRNKLEKHDDNLKYICQRQLSSKEILENLIDEQNEQMVDDIQSLSKRLDRLKKECRLYGNITHMSVDTDAEGNIYKGCIR